MSRFALWFPLGLVTLLSSFAIGCGESVETTTPDQKAAGETAPTLNVSLPEVAVVGEIPQYDPDHPQVAIETNLGTIRVELYAQQAPATVGNFLGYVNRNFYNGTIVHEVNRGFVAFAGGIKPDFQQKSTDLPIPNEAKTAKPNKAYTLAMGRAPNDADSATSQFFFNLADNASLNHRGEEPEKFGYCTFGEVVAGREIVDRIGNATTKSSGAFSALPAEQITILSIKRVR